MKPKVAFGLDVLARVTVDDEEYVIYQEREAYRYAMVADEFDEETTCTEYSIWCAETEAVSDRELALCILAECDGVNFIHLAGVCCRVDRNEEEVYHD